MGCSELWTAHDHALLLRNSTPVRAGKTILRLMNDANLTKEPASKKLAAKSAMKVKPAAKNAMKVKPAAKNAMKVNPAAKNAMKVKPATKNAMKVEKSSAKNATKTHSR